MSLRRIASVGLSLAVVAALGVGAAGSAEAKTKPTVKVMTQNLYLGASLTPAMAAKTGTEFLTAVDIIWASVLLTNFNLRAVAVADEIQKHQPDLIGLQEVTNWTNVNNSIEATPIPTFDYYKILQAELAKRGLTYKLVGQSKNASIRAPYNPESAPADKPVPSYGGCNFAQCAITLNDRDMILVRAGSGITYKKAVQAQYKKQEVLPLPDGTKQSFERGWVYSDMKLKGKKFRFINTHLETEDFASVQEAQAKALLKGPADYNGTIITTGDFNSSAAGDVTKTYNILTKNWYKDAWNASRDGAGLSCCQNEYLSNGVSELKTRIDLVLTHGKAKSTGAVLIGADPFATETPKWPSDHAGVVATITLK